MDPQGNILFSSGVSEELEFFDRKGALVTMKNTFLGLVLDPTPPWYYSVFHSYVTLVFNA